MVSETVEQEAGRVEPAVSDALRVRTAVPATARLTGTGAGFATLPDGLPIDEQLGERRRGRSRELMWCSGGSI